MLRTPRKVNPVSPSREAGKLPAFSGGAECKLVGVRGADALTGTLFQEPAPLCGDSSRVLCLLYLGQRRVIKIGLYRAYCRGRTAVTHVPTYNIVQHSFSLVDNAFANSLPHWCPLSLQQYLMHEGWIFLLTFFAAPSAGTWYPLDEVNANLGAFPCEANDFSFDKKHLAE